MTCSASRSAGQRPGVVLVVPLPNEQLPELVRLAGEDLPQHAQRLHADATPAQVEGHQSVSTLERQAQGGYSTRSQSMRRSSASSSHGSRSSVQPSSDQAGGRPATSWVIIPTGHPERVKTAISLPDALYHRAERVAQRLGRTRSALYAEALEVYLDAAEDADEVTAVLDGLYADSAAAAGPAPGAAAGRRLIDSGQWDW